MTALQRFIAAELRAAFRCRRAATKIGVNQHLAAKEYWEGYICALKTVRSNLPK